MGGCQFVSFVILKIKKIKHLQIGSVGVSVQFIVTFSTPLRPNFFALVRTDWRIDANNELGESMKVGVTYSSPIPLSTVPRLRAQSKCRDSNESHSELHQGVEPF